MPSHLIPYLVLNITDRGDAHHRQVSASGKLARVKFCTKKPLNKQHAYSTAFLFHHNFGFDYLLLACHQTLDGRDTPSMNNSGLELATTPSADFCLAAQIASRPPQSCCQDTRQISRGKFNHFLCTIAGFTAAPLMTLDFAVTCPLVRIRQPFIRFLFVDSQI